MNGMSVIKGKVPESSSFFLAMEDLFDWKENKKNLLLHI